MEKSKRKRSPDERKKISTSGVDDGDDKRHASSKSKSKRSYKEKEKRRDGEEEDKSSRHKKKHKSSRSEDKKSRDKHKVSSHKHGAHPELSSDDYFAKNNEFSTWLKEERSLFFSDLSSESARELFSDFASRWNANKLDSRYYEGIATGPRTSHNWNIKK